MYSSDIMFPSTEDYLYNFIYNEGGNETEKLKIIDKTQKRIHIEYRLFHS